MTQTTDTTDNLKETEAASSSARRSFVRRIPFSFLLLLGVVWIAYTFVNPSPAGYFDYQVRIADALLRGQLGITDPPSWLNEMVPSPRVNGLWYSVFPLGSVLSMLPVALIKRLMPPDRFTDGSIRWVISAMAVGIAYFTYRLAARNGASQGRRLFLTIFALFGTWLWPNLANGGAWQLALGFAVLGQAAALYFTLKDTPRPALAGFCFAMAFGNRTEVILAAPVFLYLLWRTQSKREDPPAFLQDAIRFLYFPFLLGIMTLVYNYARFGSAADFGYARIPGLLQEGWYRDGFTSLLAIPLNLHSMLLDSAWRVRDTYPYLIPNPMGGAIFGSSPFLFLLFRPERRDKGIIYAAWLAIILLTLALWSHGNQGGWQFSYRYALILLPWFVLILTENSPSRIRWMEVILLLLSILLNAFASYLFFWTQIVQV